MRFSYDMTIAELVDEMNSNGSQAKLYDAARASGRNISKEVIPYLFKAGGYEREGNKYVATSNQHINKTIDELLPAAKEAEKSRPTKKRTEIVKTKMPTKIKKVESNRLENGLVQIPPTEATEFILAALDLSLDDLLKLKEIAQSNTSVVEPLHESIKKLGSRERSNKTYYISKEVVELVADFTKDKNVKVSEFIELALLETMDKYK